MVTQPQADPDLWSTPPNRTPPLPLPNAPSPRGTRSLRSKHQSDSSPEIVSGISINSTMQDSGELENPFYGHETDNLICPPAPRKRIRVKPKLVPGKTAMVKRGRRLMLDNVPDSPPFGVNYRPRLLFANRTPSPLPPGQPTQPSSKVVIVVDDDDDDEKLSSLSQPENTPVRSAPSRKASKSASNDTTKQVPTLISTPSPRSIRPTTRTRKRSNSISESSTSTTSSPKGESSSTVAVRYRRKTATPSPSPKQRRRRRSLSEDRLTVPMVSTTIKGIKRKTLEEGSGHPPETPKVSTSGRRPLKSPRTPSKDTASTAGTPRKGTRGRRGVIGLVLPSTPSPETPTVPMEPFSNPFAEVSGKGKSVSRRRSSVASKESATRQNFGVLLHGKRTPIKPSFYDEPFDGFSTPDVKPRMLWPSKSPTPTPAPSSPKHNERVDLTEAVANENESEYESENEVKEKELENKVLHNHTSSASSQPLITQYATKKKRAWRSTGKMI